MSGSARKPQPGRPRPPATARPEPAPEWETGLGETFVIVLHRPQDIVNIAGTIRAMANTGFTRLRLVQPEIFDAHRIAGIAHGTEPLIEKVEFFDTLDEAVADASRIIGTTARRRTASYVWQRPREAASALVAFRPSAEHPVVLLFGPEDKGLSNEELDLCERLLVIPTSAQYPSLNLAQAVLLILYELMLAAVDTAALPSPKRRSAHASPAAMRALFDDARTALETIEFFKSRNEPMVMRSLRAVLRRADPNAREAGLLRAMAIEVRKYFERVRQKGDEPSGP